MDIHENKRHRRYGLNGPFASFSKIMVDLSARLDIVAVSIISVVSFSRMSV